MTSFETDLLMDCAAGELSNTGGTLTYGTSYSVSLSAGTYADDAGGDWYW